MSDPIVHLNKILSKKYAPTQKMVLRSLIKGNNTAKKIAGDTGITYNAVSIALHQLAKNKVINRVERGKYAANILLIYVTLMDKISKLEKKAKAS